MPWIHPAAFVVLDFVSVTGIPIFLTRSELRMLRGACVAKTVRMRVEALKRSPAPPTGPRHGA